MIAVVCGIGVGLGLLLIIRGLVGVPDDTPQTPSALASRVALLREPRMLRRIGLCAGAGVAAGLFTGWIVGAVLGFLAAWVLPGLLGKDNAGAKDLEKIEAIAAFAELLRDTLAAAAGLEQSIMACAPAAPAAIAEPVAALAARVRAGARLDTALRAFADDLADPTADLIVAALILASRRQARQLADLLSELASTARDQAALRMRTAADRARTRTSVRVITGAVLAMAGGLILLNRPYLAPYSTPQGQLVLLMIAGLFAVAFAWLRKIAAPAAPARLLTRDPAEGA